MDKYSQMKRFYHDRRLQVYMYAFMYAYPNTMTVGGHFPATKTFFVNYKKCQLQEQSQNIGLCLVTYVHNIMCWIRNLKIHN